MPKTEVVRHYSYVCVWAPKGVGMRGGKLRQQKLPFLRTPVGNISGNTDTDERVGGAFNKSINFSSSSSTTTVGQYVGYDRTEETNFVVDEK